MSSTRVAYPTSTPSKVVVAVPPTSRGNDLFRVLLSAYLSELSARPLRTKSITVGVFNFVQDILGNHLAGVPPKRVPKDAPLYEKLAARLKIDGKAFKMLLYGVFISAPLSHYTTGYLQKVFAGRTNTLTGKVAQILASCLISSPITAVSYLACSAVINGARTQKEIVGAVKRGFMTIMRISWMTTPVSMLTAQYYLSPEMWVPFFNAVTFVLGTYFNTQVKLATLAKEKREKREEKKD